MFYDVSLSVINGGFPNERSRKVKDQLAFLVHRLRSLPIAASKPAKNEKVIQILQKCHEAKLNCSSFAEVATLVDKWVVSSHFFEAGLISKQELFALGARSKRQTSYIRYLRQQQADPEWSILMGPLRRQFPVFASLCFGDNLSFSESGIQRAICEGRLYEAFLDLKHIFSHFGECSEYLYLFNRLVDAWIEDPSALEGYPEVHNDLQKMVERRPDLLMYAVTDCRENREMRMQFFLEHGIGFDNVVINDRGDTLLEYAINICDQDLLLTLMENRVDLKKIKWHLLDEAAFKEIIRRVVYLVYHFDRYDALKGCTLFPESWQWQFVLQNGLFKAALGAIESFDSNLYGREFYNTLIQDVLASWRAHDEKEPDSIVQRTMQHFENELELTSSKRKNDWKGPLPKRRKAEVKQNLHKRGSTEDRDPKKARQ